MFKVLLSLFALVSFMTNVQAYSGDSYKCKVLDAVTLDGDGKLGKDGFGYLYVDLKTEFVVDRSTGKMLNKTISNHNMNGTPKVLDRGSKDQAFKVITIYEPFVQVDYLNINTYAETRKKPFYFLSGTSFISGTCVDY